MTDLDAAREVEIDDMSKEEGELINQLRLCRRLDNYISDDAILVGDGGDFIATVAYTVSPRGPLQ